MLENKSILHAYNADDLSAEYYNSDQFAARDSLGSYVKFTTPIISQGRVYVGTADHLVAYGLFNPAAAADLTSQFTVTRGPVQPAGDGEHLIQSVTLAYHGTAPFVGQISLVLDHLNQANTLVNADGTTTLAPVTGSFYRNVFVPATDPLPVSATTGAVVTVRLKFSNVKNTNVSWTPRVLTGTGAR